MEKKTVLVTGVGGNVGQGIIRNIRKTGYPISVVGCNITSFSAGNHLCDRFYLAPYAFHDNYIQTVRNIVEQEQIDLVIPSTDYEVYYLAKYRNEIQCPIAVSDEKSAEIYLDKYKSYLHHAAHNIPFAKSFLPADYENDLLSEIIVKPREGRGSRGIHINPKDLTGFGDEYIIQELHRGKEITTAFYVNKSGELHGFITLERKLENGATNECRVYRNYDAQIMQILEDIVKHSGIRGAANLQSIVTDNGRVVPFEINCRISGTNSIRANFGFEDVKYTLQEYLYSLTPSAPQIIDGVAIRIMMDVIYPNVKDSDKLTDNSLDFYIY